MEKTWYKIFNYGTIAIAFILAGLLLIDMVRGTYEMIPRSYYYPILVVVGVIFVLRIVIRYYLVQNSKKQTN
ncbi:MAG: hypothetical protein IPJ23_04835 [Ignavibacteriales bacterium]|nr:hypothetical protein [Ignavibacteriales bacterium]